MDKIVTLIFAIMAVLPASTGANGTWPWEHAEQIMEMMDGRKETLDCVCGVPNNDVSGRIVGGVEAFPYEFGWMAVIHLHLYGRGTGGDDFCGGTIINDRLILTAAHCVILERKLKGGDKDLLIKPEDIDVTLSAHEKLNDKKGIRKEVAEIFYHPGYVAARKSGYFDYDLALLVLKEPLEFPPLSKEGIRPICLPKLLQNINTLGELVTVAGWGLMDPNDRNSSAERLQKVVLPVISLQSCRDVAKSKVTDNFLCVGFLNKYKDAASGDSGGPIKIRRGNQWTQIGIVSWSEDVGNKTSALYAELTQGISLPFVDYHSKKIGAKWCKSTV